jgi:hypothetical protein
MAGRVTLVKLITGSAAEAQRVEWHEGRPRLKLTGHPSADAVDAVFASAMVDMAGVVGVEGDAVLVAADDPAWPTDAADYEWLCGVIRDTLAAWGITGIELSFVPARAPDAEPHYGLSDLSKSDDSVPPV